MRIPIDKKTTVPVYKQIEAYFRAAIQNGTLSPGTKLPSSRQLADELGINRLTVERAFEQLKVDGLLDAKMGSGTYTLVPPAPIESSPANTTSLATAAPQSALHSFKIDFGSGIGDTSLFPYDDFRRVLQSTLRKNDHSPFTYGDAQGYHPLRVSISQILTSQGIQTCPDAILITSGSQQAIALTTQHLLQPGETIFVEAPTYATGLDLFRILNLDIQSIPIDQDGMDIKVLEEKIHQQQPKLIYTIPNYHNPTGTCLSVRRRYQLVNLAAKYNIPILEDDYVGDLRYEGHTRPALKSLDQSGKVLFTGTFSKMLIPGIRIGYITGSPEVIQALTRLKYLTDLATNNILQYGLNAYVTVGRYRQHLNRACRIYKNRRDLMQKALKAELSDLCTWQLPEGGFFFWLRLKHPIDLHELNASLNQSGVNIAIGETYFQQSQMGEQFFRLNFAAVPEANILKGISILKKELTHLMGKI